MNGLDMHVLEAGDPRHSCVVLLHGFPELAYSWRKVMPVLSAAGFHVIAPDQRGYGMTRGWEDAYDTDLRPFNFLNLTDDIVALLDTVGINEAACVVGHDFGSPVAAWCALTRPDMFRSVILMSAPFPGAPSVGGAALRTHWQGLDKTLAHLRPPRMHYQRYYSTRPANRNMLDCAQGVHDFLRAYYHVKSADWASNQPHTLSSTGAPAMAELPGYYVMPLGESMPSTVAPEMPEKDTIEACAWLPESELATYSNVFRATGFQGALNWYRCVTGGIAADEQSAWSGRTIDVPSLFIAGRQDWGIYQTHGAFERMHSRTCTRMHDCHLIDGAGHWVQQEKPRAVTERILAFLTPV
ncbi:MAG: alpha/beta hydrolase [Pseudomonadales bacterium]|nr:alpha/beta hydrolase [Pseudomonadales bacterium]